MTTTRRKAFAIATSVCTAALLAVALAYPRTVSDPTLGGDWQCRRTIFVTSCTRVEQVVPTAQNLHMDVHLERICPWRV
jgi:hypothetical protein